MNALRRVPYVYEGCRRSVGGELNGLALNCARRRECAPAEGDDAGLLARGDEWTGGCVWWVGDENCEREGVVGDR